MKSIKPALKLFLNLAKIQAVMSRRFDSGLGGLGFNEFVILFQLSQAGEGKLRRVDLAEKIGLTASGVTRILLPMEKVGLIKREVNEYDARVSYVTIAPGGKRRLAEAMERAELLAEEVLSSFKKKEVEELGAALVKLSQRVK